MDQVIQVIGALLILAAYAAAQFEIEPGRPLAPKHAPPVLESKAPGEYPSGQRGGAVNAMAMPSQVRILPPPSIGTNQSSAASEARDDGTLLVTPIVNG
jgi:hypothetical protein